MLGRWKAGSKRRMVGRGEEGENERKGEGFEVRQEGGIVLGSITQHEG